MPILMSTVSLIEPLLASVLALPRDSMGTRRPVAGLHRFGLARRLGSSRSCHSARVSPVSAPLGTDADLWSSRDSSALRSNRPFGRCPHYYGLC